MIDFKNILINETIAIYCGFTKYNATGLVKTCWKPAWPWEKFTSTYKNGIPDFCNDRQQLDQALSKLPIAHRRSYILELTKLFKLQYENCSFNILNVPTLLMCSALINTIKNVSLKETIKE